MYQKKPYAFIFWESIVGRPAYIDLCIETMKRNLSDHFELIELNLDTSKKWVPDVDYLFSKSNPASLGRSSDLSSRKIALFTDLLRIRLLAEYGGIWIDADTIIFPQISAIVNLFQSHDFFCCEADPGHLSNGFMGGRKDSLILKKLNDSLSKQLSQKQTLTHWGEFGSNFLKKHLFSSFNDVKKIYIIPSGFVIQFLGPSYFESNNAQYENDVFSSETLYKKFIPSIALATTLFNNSISKVYRSMSSVEILNTDTIFCRAFSEAMNSSTNLCVLTDSLNRAPFIFHQLEEHKLNQVRTLEIKNKLDARNADILRLKNNSLLLTKKIRNIKSRTDSPMSIISERRKIFEDIYINSKWEMGGSKSGCGSSLRQTLKLRKKLVPFLKKYNVNTLLDLPCGDFNWMKEVDLSDFNYLGADIVKQIIEQNQKFVCQNINFKVLDIVTDKLPRVDCIIVRDCFSHLSNIEVSLAIENIRNSKSKYLLVTNYLDCDKNEDIETGNFRKLNLSLTPFLLRKPIDTLVEEHPDTKHAGKSLSLWLIEDL